MKMKNPGVDVIPDMLISNKQFVQLMHIMQFMYTRKLLLLVDEVAPEEK